VKQPALGLVATLIVMAIALGFISLFDFPTFVGWVAFYNLCLIPFQVMTVVLWGANPSFAAKLSQPAKGVVLLLVNVVVAAVITAVVHALVGEGVSPPGPIPSHFVVIVVPTTFYLAIIWGGWPFTKMFKSPIVAGIALVVASYLITYVIFRVFFNYSFMQGAPVFLPSAPMGMFNAIMALVFYVTALAVMFLVLCFDLWPFTTAPGVMKQPVLGLLWTIVIFVGAAIAMQIGVVSMGMDPMAFFTKTTVPFIFGSIIVLNMLQNSLFAKMTQPVKGLVNAITAAVVGYALSIVYCLVSPFVTGQLQAGPPGYDYEVWLANSLLSVTFPFLIFYAVYFAYWPLRK
jgi:hypothetical protein